MTINLICRLFSHRFGDWEYVSAGSCKQVRTCKLDGVQEERLCHDWCEWEYASEGSCKKVRTCKRDGVEQELEDHDWGDWHQEETSEREPIDRAHLGFDPGDFGNVILMTEEQYEGKAVTVTVRYCTRCRARQEKD